MGSHAVGPLSLILDFQPSGMTAGTCITPQAPGRTCHHIQSMGSASHSIHDLLNLLGISNASLLTPYRPPVRAISQPIDIRLKIPRLILFSVSRITGAISVLCFLSDGTKMVLPRIFAWGAPFNVRNLRTRGAKLLKRYV